jgi:hypothetical protein
LQRHESDGHKKTSLALQKMQGQPSSRFWWIVVAVTTIDLLAAGVAMYVV